MLSSACARKRQAALLVAALLIMFFGGERCLGRERLAARMARADSLATLNLLPEAISCLDGMRTGDLREQSDSLRALAWHKLGTWTLKLNRNEEALACLDSACSLRERLDSTGFDYAKSLYNRGLALERLKKYAEAELSLLRSLSLRERLSGGDSTSLPDNLATLGTVLIRLAKYADAETMMRRAMAIRESQSPPDTAKVVQARMNLAAALEEQSLHLRARETLQECLVKYQLHDVVSAHVAKLHEALGSIAFNSFDYPQSLAHFTRALELRRGLIAGDSLPLFAAKYGLARCYLRNGQMDEARLLLEENRAALLAAASVDSLRFLQLQTPLADLLELSGEYRLAADTLESILAFQTRAFGPRHRRLAGTLAALALAYEKAGNHDSANVCLRGAVDISLAAMRSAVRLLPERDAVPAARMTREIGGSALSLLLNSSLRRGTPDSVAAMIMLLQKGQAMDALLARELTHSASEDEAVRSLKDSLSALRAERARLFWLKERDGDADSSLTSRMDELGERAAATEAEIVRAAHGTAEVPIGEFCIATLQSALPENSVVIEYVKYSARTNSVTSESRYAAFALEASGACRSVDLGAASELDSLVRRYRRVMQAAESPLGRSTKGAQTICRLLYQLLLDPFANELTGVERVLIAPDGELSLVSFATLMLDEETFVIDRAAVSYLNNARDLVRPRAAQVGSGLLVFADPDFDVARETVPDVTELASALPAGVRWTSNAGAVYRGPELNGLARLPGTRHEAEQVVQAWQSASLSEARLLVDDAAGEAAFHDLAPGHACIYVATHGFASETDTLMADDLAGCQSGFLLAGVNEKSATPRRDDGIVTTDELRGLDLRGTKLFVLSACESGLGLIQTGEGVLGPRRVLQLAGVEQVVTALWRLDDDVTAVIMQDVVGPENEDLSEALRAAMLKHIRSFRMQGQFPHPVEWGAMTVSGTGRAE